MKTYQGHHRKSIQRIITISTPTSSGGTLRSRLESRESRIGLLVGLPGDPNGSPVIFEHSYPPFVRLLKTIPHNVLAELRQLPSVDGLIKEETMIAVGKLVAKGGAHFGRALIFVEPGAYSASCYKILLDDETGHFVYDRLRSCFL